MSTVYGFIRESMVIAFGGRILEKGEPKCEPYWPAELAAVKNIGPLRLTWYSYIIDTCI